MLVSPASAWPRPSTPCLRSARRTRSPTGSPPWPSACTGTCARSRSTSTSSPTSPAAPPTTPSTLSPTRPPNRTEWLAGEARGDWSKDGWDSSYSRVLAGFFNLQQLCSTWTEKQPPKLKTGKMTASISSIQAERKFPLPSRPGVQIGFLVWILNLIRPPDDTSPLRLLETWWPPMKRKWQEIKCPSPLGSSENGSHVWPQNWAHDCKILIASLSISSEHHITSSIFLLKCTKIYTIPLQFETMPQKRFDFMEKHYETKIIMYEQ